MVILIINWKVSSISLNIFQFDFQLQGTVPNTMFWMIHKLHSWYTLSNFKYWLVPMTIWNFLFFTVDVPDYCKAHPSAMIPDPTNCAKFYNCSQKMAVTSECKYPDLFSDVTKQCEQFQSVSCDTRKEPQEPCKF